MIRFKIGGRPVSPGNMADALQQAMLEQVEQNLRERIGSIRQPETGEFPTIMVSGDSLDTLSLHVEGSPELVALVRQRLGGAEPEPEQEHKIISDVEPPRAFLSYAFEDSNVAQKIAEALQANGIETWWAEWCIMAGDSLRQKIEEGLGECTHFIVLLTPTSLKKPWVNLEIDAGLIRKLSAKCRFIPLRLGLPVSSLPPLLSGMLSPEVTGVEADISQLVSDIYGLSRRPPLGQPPEAVVQARIHQSPYSAAAMLVARILVDRSATGMLFDPRMSRNEVQIETGLSEADLEDALYELSRFLNTAHDQCFPKCELFAEFDQYWKSWYPAEDALKLAADLVNDENFPSSVSEIAAHYGWEPRRLNPAITYLTSRDAVQHYEVIACPPWATPKIWADANTRRFVKSRSR